jgi:ketosteroid isomerase-like protein
MSEENLELVKALFPPPGTDFARLIRDEDSFARIRKADPCRTARYCAGMSQENVDLFRESIERWNAGDFEGVLRYMHPEIRFEHRLAELGGEVTGIDALRDWVVDSRQLFDRWTTDCDDIRDLGDRVLALGTVTAVGKGSGVETKMPFTVVATVKNGLVTHFVDYGDREKALEAAGLSE